MPLLGDIFSTIDSAKRKGKDLAPGLLQNAP
jgi:hypothetical protein